MNILLLSGGKQFSLDCINYLLSHVDNYNIIACVNDASNDISENIKKICNKNNIDVISTEEMYEKVELLEIDIAVSLFYTKRIRQELIDVCKWGCINFHPAPIPQYRGLGSMCFGILDKIDYWEITAHFIVDEQFDAGRIIATKRIFVDIENDPPHTIEKKLYPLQLELFKEVIEEMMDKNGKVDSQVVNIDEGHYYSRKDWLLAKKINKEDDLKMIQRKVKAFWYPKSGGAATITIQNKDFYIIDDNILKEIKEHYIELNNKKEVKL